MNVIVPIAKFTKLGGIERYVVEMVDCFLKCKEIENVTVVCSELDRKTVPYDILDKIDIKFTKSKGYGIGYILESHKISKNLKERLGHNTIIYTQQGQTIGGDVVVAHAVHFASILKLNKTFFAKSIRLFYPPHARACFLDFYNHNVSKRSIAVSRLIKNQLIDYLKIPGKKIEIVYSGVNTDDFCYNTKARSEIREQLNIKDKIVLIFVGNVFKIKNLTTLIKAFGTLKMEDVVLLVVGRDNPKAYLSLAEKYGCGKNIKFLGLRSDVSSLFSASDIFVFPTLYEAFPLVVLEAMATKLPIIISNAKFNGAAELIEDGFNGILLNNPMDSKELYNKINCLINDKELRRSLGENARKTAEKFSWEMTFKKTFEVFNKVIS